MTVGDEPVTLVLWDIYGEDTFQSVRTSYLRGAAGYLLVADGTRQLTLDTARSLQKTAAERRRAACRSCSPSTRSDLIADWQVDDKALWKIADDGLAHRQDERADRRGRRGSVHEARHAR